MDVGGNEQFGVLLKHTQNLRYAIHTRKFDFEVFD